MSPTTNQSSRGIWTGAFLVAVLLHLGALVGIARVDLFASPDERAVVPEESPTIQVVFPQEEPQRFTELPSDRADEAPEDPDFLSNLDSRARDLVEGGEDRLPSQDGRVEFPQVEMVEGSVPEAQGTAVPEFRPVEQADESSEPRPDSAADPQADSQTDPQSDESSREISEVQDPVDETMADATAADASSAEATSADAPPADAPPADAPPADAPPTEVFRPSRTSTPPGETWTPPGNSDIRQERSASPGSNADLPGDISLNTTAWDWAPWLGEFRRKLLGNWSAPIGYRLGMTHGFTVMRLTINPDGTLEQLDVLDERGHEALKRSSLDAVGRTRPFQPLPVDFPEEHLILTLTLSYPEASRYGR